MQPPVATVTPHQLEIHGDVRVDDYYWLRDREDPAVIAYLEAENEYTHAVFREQTGGDRPYWLNEGLAERIERGSRRLPASTRSERASLRTRIAGGDWIALRRIAPSFSGLQGDDARAAYLQSIVAAEYIEAHTDAGARARLLMRLGEGWSADQAL